MIIFDILDWLITWALIALIVGLLIAAVVRLGRIHKELLKQTEIAVGSNRQLDEIRKRLCKGE